MTEASTGASVREFRMPDVGEGLTEADILSWHVGPGDTVTDGQVVCEVETAKAAVELPIPYNGVVRELHFEEGTTVDVGQVIISVEVGGGAGAAPPAESAGAGSAGAVSDDAASDEAEEEAPRGRQPVLVGYGVSESSTKRRPRKGQQVNGHAAGQEAPQPPARAAEPPAPPAPAAAPPAPAAAPPGPATGQPASVTGQRPLAKPPVRKLAKDLGVDLAAVVPTGAGGVITREDVHAAAAPPAPPARPQAPAPEPAPGPEAPAAAEPAPAAGPARETRVPVKGVRKATAQAMVGSAFTAPHVTEFVTVDVTRTVKLVEELRRDADRFGLTGLRINPLLLIAKALLLSIKRNPEVNAAWDEERQEIVHKHYVNLGIAADTPRGLVVPNIKDADTLTLPRLAEALADLVSTAREGRTSPAAMRGGTVTITNVGVFGVDSGTPILNPGESAILAVGAIRLQPWVHKGKVKPRRVTTLSLSFDHRLVDGALGSRVLADVAAVLEEPKRFLAWG